MRVHYVYCHPVPTSFHAAIRDAALAGLGRAGHEVDLLDLYASRFDPVLSADERLAYHDLACNRRGVEEPVARLAAADALILQFPVWNFGLPAMLKGWFDRVFKPGVSFALEDGRARALLGHLCRIEGIATYGQPWHAAMLMGDPPRKTVTRFLRWHAPRASRRFTALYDLNRASEARRYAFIGRVERRLERLG